MDQAVLDWLLEGPAWLRYAVETQLLGREGDRGAAADEALVPILTRIRSGEVGIPAMLEGKITYTGSGNAFWDLFFLADVGIRANDVGIGKLGEALLSRQASDGTFVLQPGTRSSCTCIPAIVLTALVRMGWRDDPRIGRFLERVWESRRLDGGWHCAVSRARGGRLEATESCPMDNLNLLMLLGQYPQNRNDPRLRGAIDLLLAHWRRREEPWRPYGFGIGTEFKKLRYPAAKYGILRVISTLSLYPHAAASPEFAEMMDWVQAKAVDGRFRAESVSRAYTDFDFGRTGADSRWITFLAERAGIRAGQRSGPV